MIVSRTSQWGLFALRMRPQIDPLSSLALFAAANVSSPVIVANDAYPQDEYRHFVVRTAAEYLVDMIFHSFQSVMRCSSSRLKKW